MKAIKQLLFLLCVICSMTSMGQSPNTIVLNNGVIKIKLDLNSGGAISYLSAANSNYNVVNVHDKGRYIQQSYYTGQFINRSSAGQHPNWSPWNWNPIQAGDVYGNSAQIISYSQTSNQLYVKTRPKLWDMNNELCECFFETWVTLEGTAARVKNKITTFRTDNLWQTRAYSQELPAVYTRGDLYKLYSYRGSSPWTNGGLSRIPHTGPPWARWYTSERWAALVNNGNWGLGVYNPTSTSFIGGFSGSPGGGPTNSSTGYVSPLRTRTLSRNGTFEYEYYLILGNLNHIRNFVYNKRGINTGGNNANPPIRWEFNQNGNTEGWNRSGGASSISTSGGSLRVASSAADPQIIRSVSFNPRLYDFLKIGMRNFTNNGDMDFFWSNSSGGFSGSKRIRVPVVYNSNQREYVFDLRNVSQWKNGGTINAIRIDPPGNGSPSGEYVRIDYIRFTGTGSSKQSIPEFDDNSIKVYPKPFTDELNIETTEKRISLFNLQGEEIKISTTKTENGFQLNSENLTPGLYLLRVGDKVFKISKY